ncbi:hypothetical protein IQ250_01750 [Pseudanabaenaceae cyanobacterium LEGE 13415]|nr:hypothetical protein [Pseudanabaenaceae cyanobacterium LEGE 13415]
MEFYWTTDYQHQSHHHVANTGAAFLVVDYTEEQRALLRSSRSGTDPRSEALEIAKVFATELIADRPSELLWNEPELVFQVQQL